MDISRDPAFLKDLYTTELYSIKEKKTDPAAEAPAVQESAAPYTNLGDGSSGVALLFPENPGDEELSLVVKILASIQIPIASTLQFTEIPENIDQLLADCHIHTVISFGVAFNNSKVTILQTQSPAILQTDIEAKKELWASLKAHFQPAS
jgi:hypothetical protein